MEQLSFKIAETEGPLDLILQLIRQHKLDIYDIEISKLLEQYMNHIQQWQEMDMEIASDFLEMASRLVYIKSVSLLPKHEELEEKLKSELTGQLIEYQLCQQMARRLAVDYVGGDLFIRDGEEVEPDMTYHRVHKPEEMLDAFLSAAGRGKRRLPPPAQAFHGIVARKIVPVSTKITYVLRKLYSRGKVSYHSLFGKAESKSDLVATFLALLELIKSKRISVDGEGEDQQVQMRPPEEWDTTVPEEFDDNSTEEREYGN
jgi:segregation and condensation protein A